MRLFSRIALYLLLATSVAFAQQTIKPAKSPKTAKIDPGIKKYGNVAFADPDHHKYPIDNVSHTRGSWSAIHKKQNAAKYKPEELTQVKQRIHDAGVAQGVKFKDDTPKAPRKKTIKSSSK